MTCFPLELVTWGPFLSMRSSFLRSISVGKSNSSGALTDFTVKHAQSEAWSCLPSLRLAGFPSYRVGRGATQGRRDTHDKVMCYDILPTQPLAAIEMLA